MTSHKVIAISQWWAGIFAVLLTSAIIGGVAYAIDNMQEMERTKTKFEAMEAAKLPERMTRLETKVENIDDGVRRIESGQAAINEKIDRLIEQRSMR